MGGGRQERKGEEGKGKRGGKCWLDYTCRVITYSVFCEREILRRMGVRDATIPWLSMLCHSLYNHMKLFPQNRETGYAVLRYAKNHGFKATHSPLQESTSYHRNPTSLISARCPPCIPKTKVLNSTSLHPLHPPPLPSPQPLQPPLPPLPPPNLYDQKPQEIPPRPITAMRAQHI